MPQALDPRTALGAHYADALAAHDRLAGLDDAELAASVLVVAADVTEARHHLPGVESPSVIELRQGGGFARTVPADPGLAALVGACDGDLPVGVLIDAIASLLEVDAAELRGELLPARARAACSRGSCGSPSEVGSGPAHARSISSTHAQHGRWCGASGRARRVADRRDAGRGVRRRGA